MDIYTQKFYQFAFSFIKVLALLFFFSLFAVNLIWTCYCTDMTSQEVLTKRDSLFLNAAIIIVTLFLTWLLAKWIRKNPKLWKKCLLIALPFHVAFWGVILVLFSKTVPAADALSAYQCTEQIASGNLSSIAPTGSYLSYYPQQIGLIALWEPLFRLMKLLPFEVRYYHLLKLLYVVMTYCIMHYLYKITHTLWKRDETDCFCLLFCALNAPLIMYSSFLYSEIPSLLLLFFSFYHLLLLLEWKTDTKVNPAGSESSRKRAGMPRLFLASLIGMTLAVLLRKNNLIFIIAAVIVLFFEWIRQKRKELFLSCVLTLVLSLSILPCVIKLYELRAGNTLKSGVPAMAYFAMGMQESTRAAGWYNGYNFNTYDETGMDKEKTVALSKKAISDRCSYFRNHPDYAVSFYVEKFLSQWADGTYASRQATLATYGGRTAFFQEVYDGKYSKCFISYCNAYQLLLYFGALCFGIFTFPFFGRRKSHAKTGQPLFLFQYLLFIGAFGGFLFHMIWEANSRYVLPYWLCLFPYCVYGLTLFIPFLSKFSFFPHIEKREIPQAAETDTEAERRVPKTK